MRFIFIILCLVPSLAFAAVGNIEAYVQSLDDPNYFPDGQNFVLVDTGN